MEFITVNPFNNQKMASLKYSSEHDAEVALQALAAALAEWRLLSYQERQTILLKLGVALEAKKDFFAQLMTREMGKPIKESIAEVKKCYETIEVFCRKDLSFLQEKLLHSTYESSFITYQPLGIICSIMPWNYPLWQVIRMVIPALLIGNTVLLKHAEITAETGIEFAKLFNEVWTKSILRHCVMTHEMTELVLADPRVQGVSLTGSTRAGMSVARTAAQYLKKYVLELGGSDPYLVLADADLDLAAKIIAKSRLMNAGQSCISAKRCLVDESIKDLFIEKIKTEFSHYVVGNPADSKTDIGPLAHRKFKDSLAKQLAELQTQTGALKIYSQPHGQSEDSACVNPEIYLLKENSRWLSDQEFFAPVLIMIPFNSDTEAVKIANSTVFALGGGVFSKDLVRARKIASEMIAGQVAINDLIRSDVSLPFGGFKQSGVGRELGDAGFFEFAQTKVISNS